MPERTREGGTTLCHADHRMVGLVLPVLILQQSNGQLKPQLQLGAEAMSGYTMAPCDTACSPDRRVHPRPAVPFCKLLLPSGVQVILGTPLLSQSQGLYTNLYIVKQQGKSISCTVKLHYQFSSWHSFGLCQRGLCQAQFKNQSSAGTTSSRWFGFGCRLLKGKIFINRVASHFVTAGLRARTGLQDVLPPTKHSLSTCQPKIYLASAEIQDQF